jgi:hypothetical protein
MKKQSTSDVNGYGLNRVGTVLIFGRISSLALPNTHL